MTTYVLKLAKRGETAICFGQAKIALGPGAGGALAAPGDKCQPASSCQAGAGTSGSLHTTEQFQELGVFQLPPTSSFFTSNTSVPVVHVVALLC